MTFLKVTIKILVILAAVALMAAPFVMEYFTFRGDKKKKISYKRFRIVIYTAVYMIAVTLVLYLAKEVLLWVGNLSLVQWLSSKISVDTRVTYCVEVFAVILTNVAIGFLYVLIGKFVRIGLKKHDLVHPKKKDGTYTFFQKLERKMIRFFYTETWFFVAKILKYVNIFLSVVYGLMFALYQVPAMFGASWIPYKLVGLLFASGYMFPTITLLGLWEAFFFLEGIKRLEDECPELCEGEKGSYKRMEVDLAAIDEEVKKQFKDYYVCDVDISKDVHEDLASCDHHRLTELIARAVENDERNPQQRREVFLNCLDKLVSGDKSLLINGNFFSEFSLYFLRYLSAVIARGDNVVFVCNSDAQIDMVYDYVVQGLSEISSLYCKGFRTDDVNFDRPIWRAVKVSGERSVVEEAAVDENSILVTSLSYLCSTRFESEHSRFVSLLDAVVFVDALNTINKFNRQLAILNTRIKHLVKKNALAAKNGKPGDEYKARYMSRQVRYIGFDDTRTPGIDKVLKNMLSVEFDSADAMNYNEKTLVRCYRYEGRPDENGRRVCPQFLTSEEEIGAIMNMAILCLAKGASSVTVFSDDILPYENIAETLAANMGKIAVQADGNNIRINKQFYNPDAYSVIIAMDAGDNLPATIRKYTSMVSDQPAMVIIFSRPYMMREYYISNISETWSSSQAERIPVEEGTRKDIAQRVLVKANAGGISKEEVFRLATGVPQFAEYAADGDINSILREILLVYGVQATDRINLFNYFEYTSSQDFDEAGKFSSEIKIVLRKQGEVFEKLNGRDMVTMIVGDYEIVLPVPRSRLTQNYIAGQNLVYNGKIYYIHKIDVSTGRIYARLAVGGKNDEAYRYIQARDYHVELEPVLENVFPTKHVVIKNEGEDVHVSDAYISVFRAPAEVVTRGYYKVDPHLLAVNFGTDEYYSISDLEDDTLIKQTYRRYGTLTSPAYASEDIIKTTDLNISEKPALMMSVRLCGQFGPDIDKTMALAAAMLNEQLHTMFPSVADSVAVCPVFTQEFEDEERRALLRKQPKLTVEGENSAITRGDFNLVIIEDCASDLGVVSVLMSAGDDVLKTLFGPLFNYLSWYAAAEKKDDYLYYGLDHEPECFDFASLLSLSKILGDDGHDLKFVDLDTIIDHAICDFCGKRYAKGDDIVELEDGRKMCKACAENLVGNNAKALKEHLERARIYLESTYGITLGDDYEVCFDSTVKIVNTLKQNPDLLQSNSSFPLKSYIDSKKKVHVEYSLPSANLSELLVRELTHVWQLKHLPELADDLAEGHRALVGIQYLRFLKQDALATNRTTYYESTNTAGGEGYRKLVRELLLHPEYNNNPFLYLLNMIGGGGEVIPVPKPHVIPEDGDYGLPYTPENPDRVLNGTAPYFYYSRLSDGEKNLYDTLLEAVQNHAETATVEETDFDVVRRIMRAVEFDHPELFWYRTFKFGGTTVTFLYGATAEECASLQKRIDEEVNRILSGITDSMCAYEVTLRLHNKLIAMMDYDMVALRKEEEAGGPAYDIIDPLRSICGAFLDHKIVCEGYARAIQYLLQKCGIECAEVAGHTKGEGAHGWNIVKIDGDYYYLDTTWDDNSNTVQEVKRNELSLVYFCIMTEELLRTRKLDLNPMELPVCNATRANYYHHNGLVLDSYDLKKIISFAEASAKAKRPYVTFKFLNQAAYDESYAKLLASGSDWHDVMKAASKADKRIDADGLTGQNDDTMRVLTLFFKYK